MDCSRCGEPVGPAMIFCQHCGARFPHPAHGSGTPIPPDGAQWNPRSPARDDMAMVKVGSWIIEVLVQLFSFPTL